MKPDAGDFSKSELLAFRKHCKEKMGEIEAKVQERRARVAKRHMLEDQRMARLTHSYRQRTKHSGGGDSREDKYRRQELEASEAEGVSQADRLYENGSGWMGHGGGISTKADWEEIRSSFL